MPIIISAAALRSALPAGPPTVSGTLTDINLVDLFIAAVLLVGLANGYRRGFWLSAAQYAGMVAGVIASAALAPHILDVLAISGPTTRPWAALLVLVVGGSLGSTAGYWLGEPLRRAMTRTGPPHRPELVAGALFSGFAVILTCWFLGLSFTQGPSPDLARLIQRSAILRGVTSTLPPPPGFLIGVERTLAGVPFPQTFAGLEPSITQLQLPTEAATPQVQNAAASVYRVEGRGCGGVVTGSAYPVAPGYFVTNAHVVSGTSGTTLSRESSRFGGMRAAVVLFDPARDVAILYAPALSLKALPDGQAGRGTQGAVVGYPGGGRLDVEAAVVDSGTVAQGRDIYNDQLVPRSIWIIQSTVRPGNSGGPLLDLDGRVIGLVFAASSSNPSQAYALTNEEISGDIKQGTASRQSIDASALACAV